MSGGQALTTYVESVAVAEVKLRALRVKLDAALTVGGYANDEVAISLTKDDAAWLLTLVDEALE